MTNSTASEDQFCEHSDDRDIPIEDTKSIGEFTEDYLNSLKTKVLNGAT